MLYGIGGFLLLCMLWVFKKSGSFFKALVSSFFGCMGALCAVNAVSCFIPLSVGLNFYTLAFSSVFSVPGVIFLLLSGVLL